MLQRTWGRFSGISFYCLPRNAGKKRALNVKNTAQIEHDSWSPFRIQNLIFHWFLSLVGRGRALNVQCNAVQIEHNLSCSLRIQNLRWGYPFTGSFPRNVGNGRVESVKSVAHQFNTNRVQYVMPISNFVIGVSNGGGAIKWISMNRVLCKEMIGADVLLQPR